MKSVALVEMLQDWLGEGMVPVSRDVAQARANVCLQCPKNEEGRIDEFFKAPVAAFIRKQIEAKNGMKLRVEGEKKLHICSVCGCAIKLKAWVPANRIGEVTDDETLDAFPPNCWVPPALTIYLDQPKPLCSSESA